MQAFKSNPGWSMTLLAAGLFAATSCTTRDADPPKAHEVKQEKTMWPPLPTKGFLSGRTATKEDMANGDAAFFLPGSGTQPMKIEIPQYAYHVDAETGKRSAGIIIQAERAANGTELVAMQPIEGGGPLIALLGEYQLLGRLPPKGE
jgi:hypothetical protein